jgi:hypothetical protein
MAGLVVGDHRAAELKHGAKSIPGVTPANAGVHHEVLDSYTLRLWGDLEMGPGSRPG